MKTRMFSLIMLMGLGSFALFAGSPATEKFKVAGNCGMCEARIEKAAKSVEGVSAADWDKETKMIEVSFDTGKTDIHKVHMAIAKAGHDTEMHKASDEAYEKLPGCCKYNRMENQAAATAPCCEGSPKGCSGSHKSTTASHSH
ncbi:MAG: copper chaperone [Bacteroidetes bacterium]|nr:MAG: copper chaperone [Bacteroidota bacterium]